MDRLTVDLFLIRFARCNLLSVGKRDESIHTISIVQDAAETE